MNVSVSSCRVFPGLACAAVLALLVNVMGWAQSSPAVPLRPAADYGRRPLSFERNVGQSNPQVKFLARGQGYTLFLTSTEAVMALRGGHKAESEPRPPGSESGEAAGRKQETTANSAVLRMKLVGANPAAPVAGLEELPGKSHYLIGNDPQQWHSNVSQYAKVRYQDIYPGVDLVYYGNQRQLEHDFIVAPGASPRSIRLRLDGAERVSLEENGDLHARLAGREVRLLRPVIYQQDDAERRIIAGGYALGARNEVGFRLGAYDRSKPLVIDPVVLSYSSYLGGNEADEGNAIAVDAAGNAYVTGSTGSPNFPLRGAIQSRPTAFQDIDAFVTKVSPAGAVVYSTYLGGGSNDTGYGIAVDSTGAAYVAGATNSNNFPVQNAIQPTRRGTECGGPCFDAFVAKLNPAGSALVYSTFLGGSLGDDYAYAIALDPQGNAYVAGETHSDDFPTLNPFQAQYGHSDDARFPNAFVTKINAAGSALLYSTFLGSTSSVIGSGIAADAAGNAYVTGNVNDNGGFPTTPGAFQRDGGCCIMASVSKFNPQGNGLVYSTFLGGVSFLEDRTAIAIDSSGNAYVTGRTPESTFPTTANAFQRTLANPNGVFTDAFVTKLNPTGTALVYSTFLGGNNQDAGQGIAVDSLGYAYVTGFTRSTNFPILAAAQGTFGGGTCVTDPPTPCSDVFVTELNPAGNALSFSTFLGGNLEDEGRGIAVDAVGYPYITGVTHSRNFPTLNAFQAQTGDLPANPTSDAFVTKLIEPPLISQGGTVNGASFIPGAAVAPGSIISVFGIKFAPLAFATAVPLPVTLGGMTLRFNTTIAAPLFFTSPSQTNIQVPWELEGQTSASVTATASGLTSTPENVPLATYAPGIFSTTPGGKGQGAILIAATGEVAAPTGSIPGRATRPAGPGEFLTIFCTGLGPVTNRPATGAIAPTSPPLATTTANPTAAIGGDSATVSFSGLAPGFVGLYQVNVQVPPTARAGNEVPVVVTIGGATSNTVTIAVQQ